MKLSTAERTAIREVADGGQLTRAMRRRLVERGLVEPGRGDARFTAAGEEARRNVMASGDGPEALKAMFR